MERSVPICNAAPCKEAQHGSSYGLIPVSEKTNSGEELTI